MVQANIFIFILCRKKQIKIHNLPKSMITKVTRWDTKLVACSSLMQFERSHHSILLASLCGPRILYIYPVLRYKILGDKRICLSHMYAAPPPNSTHKKMLRTSEWLHCSFTRRLVLSHASRYPTMSCMDYSWLNIMSVKYIVSQIYWTLQEFEYLFTFVTNLICAWNRGKW